MVSPTPSPSSASSITRIANSMTIAAGGHHKKMKLTKISVIQAAVLCATFSVVSFYFGILLGSSAARNANGSNSNSSSADSDCIPKAELEARIRQGVKIIKKSDDRKKSARERMTELMTGAGSRDTDPRFPEGMGRLAVGMAQVDRDEFAQKFNLGVPLDLSDRHNNKVLIMYSNLDAMPSDTYIQKEAASMTKMPEISTADATANCDFLHIILQDHHGDRRQCTAIFGQYEAFHIQKFMRLPEQKGPLDPDLPLRLVNRGSQSNGRKSTSPPDAEMSRKYWKTLQAYLGQLDDALETLRPLAAKAAVNNTIIVQVCNFGQSELLLNFLCSATRRNLDLSAVLIFATDQETYDLVTALDVGVTVVFHKEIFGEMPSGAARRYGDAIFMKMMMAKVYCVHLIALLGYDVLFQDVDVVWYRNPLHYFHDEKATDAGFDVYFQDDGNHAMYYAPYSANTGFYYVRNNDRTVYFFNSLLMAGDLVSQSKSHQIPLVALLQEHASMYGLKIKIFSRDEDTFPGGHAFHRRKSFLKAMFAGEAHPEIFHMSWTNSKINKRKFLQQMGEFYLQDQCIGKKLKQIPQTVSGNVQQACCAAEPNVVCHYKDKPSKIPCKEFPSIDQGGRSFW